MAHGRSQPDIVMTTRYVGASEIRQVTDHEESRTPDGSSAIDPLRTHLNTVLHGPSTQQEALEQLWKQGVKKPTAQAERPYVQTVLSASPSYFRGKDQGPGEWDSAALDGWVEATMKWLRKTYGNDLVHASLHLDEDTPHIHVLVVPTYERKPRKPGRRKKGETPDEFEARKQAALDGPTIRTASRSSNAHWLKEWVRLNDRKSYHAAVESLGLGYGKDFVGEDAASPVNKTTGRWVREEAARLADERKQIEQDRAQMIEDAKISSGRIRADAEARAMSIVEGAKMAAKAIREDVEVEKAQLAQDKAQLYQDRADFELEREEVNTIRKQLKEALTKVVRWIKGKELSEELAAEGTELVRDHHRLVSPPKDAVDDAGPGF